MSKIPSAAEEKRPYFAYGSNLWLDQMRRRCPGHKRVGTAVLSDHRVVCNKVGDNRVDFYAGIIVSPGDEVIGVLYQLTPEDIKELDKKEGIKELIHYYRDEKDFYVKNRETGELVNAFTYFVVSPVTPKKPTFEYAEKIFQGCRDHNFPEEYVKKLRSWFFVDPEKP